MATKTKNNKDQTKENTMYKVIIEKVYRNNNLKGYCDSKRKNATVKLDNLDAFKKTLKKSGWVLLYADKVAF